MYTLYHGNESYLAQGDNVAPEVGRRPTTRIPSEGLHSVRPHLEVLRPFDLSRGALHHVRVH